MTHSRNGKSKFANVTGIFLLFLIAESWISFSSGQAVCASPKVRLVFAIDGSTNMGQANFSSAVTFAVNVSHRLGVSANMTCIYFVFGNETASYDIGGLMNAKENLSARFPNDPQVKLGAALDLVKKTLFNAGSRENVTDAVVIITSDKSQDDIAVPTIDLKTLNVTLLAMGVGDKYSLGQLNEIATDLDENHVITLNSWEDANDSFVFEVAKKVSQVFDSCASFPCYNNGTCTSWEGGYNCTCSVEYFGENCEKSKSVEYLSLGCFNDQNETRAIPSLESSNATYLKGSNQTRENAVLKCALEAAKMGYKAFAVQDGGACYSSPFAHLNYSVFGVTNCPPGGKGGHLVSEVYLLGAKCGKMLKESLVPISNATIRGSSYRDPWGIPFVDGDYSWCPRGNETKRKIEVELKIRLFDSRDQIIRGSSYNDSWILPLVDRGLSWLPSDGGTGRQLDSGLKMILLDFRNQTVRSLFHNESWVIPLVDHDYVWLSSDPRRRLDIELNPFERETFLTKLSVQGKKGAKDYADNFCVGLDGIQNITRNYSTCLIDLSTQSSNDITTIPFSDTLTAQYLKFAPWRPLRGDGLCLRIDVFENDNTSSPISIVRDGSYNGSFSYTSIRVNLTELPLVNSNVSWCPADADLVRNPALTVDLGRLFNITQVQVQGAMGANEWPYKICLSYSANGSHFIDLKRNESSCLLFGQGLEDGNGDRTRSHQIAPPRVLRSLSFVPKYPVFKTGDGFCTRTELTGCVTTTLGGELVTEGCYKTKRNKCCVFPFWYKDRHVYSCINDNHILPWCATTDNYTRDHLWDNCEGLSNPCQTNPCLNGGTCEGNKGDWSYNCICPEGFWGDNCQHDCDECFNEIDPCIMHNTRPSCDNTIGSYKCSCENLYGGQNCQLDCRSNKIELGFLLDGSASVGENNFKAMKDFIKTFTTLFAVPNVLTRVGVIVYSTNSTLAFPLDQHLVQSQLADAVNNIPYPGGGTYTGQALNDSVITLFNSSVVRVNVSKILVLVTDGVSTDDVISPSKLVNESGVTPFVVGIGRDFDRSQLTKIALGVENHVFTAEFDSLGDVENNLRDAICRAVDKCFDNPCHFGGICLDEGSACNCTEGLQGATCREDVKECSNSNITCQPGKTCTETFGSSLCTCENIKTYGENCTKDCSKASTVLFIMETSRTTGKDNILLQVEFIISVASTLTYQNIGVIAYSTNAHFVTRPGQSSNMTDFAQNLRTFNYVMGCRSNQGKAFIRAKEESQLFASSKSAVIAVIFPPWSSSDDAITPAVELKNKKVTIIGFPIIRPLRAANFQELLKILTNRMVKHKFDSSGFTGLKNVVAESRELICRASNPCSDEQNCLPGFDCKNLFGIQGEYECVPSLTACNPDPCKNGGNCTLTNDGSYNCSCIQGIIGQNCTKDYNECFNSPCQNGGTCFNKFGDYNCICNHGYFGKNCHLDCKFSEIELGFVVDGSDSARSNFSMINNFIKNLTRTFNVSSNETRVGVIIYSTSSTVAITLDQYSNISEIEEAIDNLRYPGGQTNIGQALNKSVTSLFNSSIVRQNVSKILVVITDGISTDEVTGSLTLVNDTGVIPFVLGIGEGYDRSQLDQIALGVVQHVFTADVDSVGTITSSMREAICRVSDKCADNPCHFGGVCKKDGSCLCAGGLQGATCTEDDKECLMIMPSVNCPSGKACTETFGGYQCTCENITKFGENCTKDCSKKTTIIFLVDTSRNTGQDNVLLQVEFIISVAYTLAYENIGVIAYSNDAHFVTRPGQSSNITEFTRTLRTFNYNMGLMTNLGKALMKAKEEPELFNSSRSAIIVALVTWKSEDEHSIPAFDLKNNSVTIIGLGVGSNYIMADLYLLATASQPDHILTSQFSELKNLITITRDRICQAANPCSSANCLPGESCANLYGVTGGYICNPPASVCYPSPCRNGGNCTINGNGFYNCSCPHGIGGQNCTEDVFDECHSEPCKNGGSCENLLGGYKCNCTSHFTGRQCDIVCSFQKFNLVFLVDGSGSIENQGPGNFRRIKDFVNGIIESFDISRGGANVAVVLFSDNVEVIFPLNAYYNKSDMTQAVEAMQYPHGGTNIGKGLDMVRNQVLANLGNRGNLTNVVIVVTDGKSSDDVQVPSRMLRNMNVTIFSVGVGCCYDIFGLKDISTDPDDKFVFRTDFTTLDTIVGRIREQICSVVDHCSHHPCANGGTCNSEPSDFVCNCTAQWTGKDCWTDVDECVINITRCPNDQVCHNFPGGSTCLCTDSRYGENCSSHCNFTKIDIAFLLDSSQSINSAGKKNFQIIKDFVKAIVKSVKIGRNETEFGMATFSDLNLFSVHFNFSSYSNTSKIVEAIQRIPYDAAGTYAGNDLNRIRTELFPMARNGIPNILMVITDGQSQDSVTNPSRSLRGIGVHIMSVGIGDAVYEELADMATDPDNENIFRANFSSIHDLVGSIIENNCKVADPCQPQPCQNEGTCHVMEDLLNFRCECTTGWIGRICETDINECQNSPCINNALGCRNTPGSYECNCNSGFAGRQCQIGILKNIFDVVFLFDGSATLGNNRFMESLLFAKGVLSPFNISREYTNVAAAVYAHNTTISFNFTEYYTYGAVASAIDAVPFLNQSPLNLSVALKTINRTIISTSRENTTAVVVVFVSNTLSGNCSLCQALHNQGVRLIAVGMGDQYDYGQLVSIASDPPEDFVITFRFQHMDAREGVVSGAIAQAVDLCSKFPCRFGGRCKSTSFNFTCACPVGCLGLTCVEDVNECIEENPPNCTNGTTCINTWGSAQCVCQGNRYGPSCQYHLDTRLDLVFLLDSSLTVTQDNFTNFLYFVRGVSETLNVSQEETHVAVVLFGDIGYLKINLNDNYNQSALEEALDHIPYKEYLQTNMGAGLSMVASIFSSNEARSNASRVLVILTATTAQDDTEVPSFNLLRNHNVTVFSLGVGVQVSVGQMNEIASDPDSYHVRLFSSGNDLPFQLARFKTMLGKALDPCSDKPCHNGVCHGFKGGYTCNCASGFSGKNCEKADDPCNPRPCQNKGKCVVLPLNSYYCICPEGWTGVNCSEDQLECSMAACKNAASCHEMEGNYSCSCEDGFAGKNCDRVCNEDMIDLVFMLEGSASLNQWGESNFEKIVNVTKHVVNFWNRTQSRIGLVLYSTTAELKINFTHSEIERNEILDNLPYPSAWTVTGNALKFVNESLLVDSRSNARRVLVVFTDGTSTDAVKDYSKEIRDNLNVTIIVVALGDWYDIKQVESIASQPHSKHLLQAKFDELQSLNWRLHEMICEAVDHCFSDPCRNNRSCTSFLHHYECDCGNDFSGENCEEVIDQCSTSNTCVPGQICIGRIGSHDCVCAEGFYGNNCTRVFNGTFDLVFLVDGTRDVLDDNFRSSLRFVKNLAKVFNKNTTHIGLVVYAEESKIVFNLTDPFPLTDTNMAISSVRFPNQIIRNTGSALSHSKVSVIDAYGRPGVPKVLVVLEGWRSSDGIDGISQVYRTSGFHVFGVGNGNQPAAGQLKEISSGPSSRFFNTIGYEYIDMATFVQQMKESIATAIAPCSSSPCHNNGSCVAKENSFSCQCPARYTGISCDQELSPCLPNPCENGGQCHLSGSSYSCNCQPGFYQLGKCQDDINECDSNPCQNNGQCENTLGSYYCVCPHGFLGINCGSVCTHQVFNMAFLIDGSASIKNLGAPSAAKYKDLVKTVVDFYHVSPVGTNVATVVFSSNATTIFKLDTYYSKSDINATIDAIVFPGKATRIGNGLTVVRNEVFANARSGIPNIFILITDGVSIDDIVLPSTFLKAMKVVMFAVGVGEFYAKEQLEEISSDPDVTYVFESDTADLPELATQLKNAVCAVVDHCYSNPCQNGGVCQSLAEGYSCTCQSGFTGQECQIDVNECSNSSCSDPRKICINFPGTSFCNCKPGNFLIQNSCNGDYNTTIYNIGYILYIGQSIDQHHKGSFAKEIAFVKGLSKTFNVSSNEVNFGIITYAGEAQVMYGFADFSNQLVLENALNTITITGSGRNIGRALNLARTNLFNQSSPGQNVHVHNVLIVVTDGGSDDPIAAPAYALREANVTIFTVAIGRYVHGQLKEMASDPDSDHMFTTEFYGGLGPLMADVKDAIIKEVKPCYSSPCQNLGTCSNRNSGGYLCTCSSEWTGINCESRSTPCTAVPHSCNDHGNCTVRNDNSIMCNCTTGWDGTRCENDINECLHNPCLNGGNCTNTNGGYYCQCPIYTVGVNCEKHCDHHVMNLGFLVDASAAVELSGNGNFNTSLAFVANFIKSFSVTPNETHAGMVVFSDDLSMALDFQHGDISSAAVESVYNASYLNQGRQTGKALTYVRRNLFSESLMQRIVPNYFVYLTSGSSYDLVKTPASLLRGNNITVFAVGVGEDYDVQELKEVTGNNSKRVYETTFSKLANLGALLKKEICELQDQNTCVSSPCSNGGFCVNTGNNYRCDCARGYYGRQCENGCGFRELGIKVNNERRIPDEDMTSSSQRDANHPAYRGRVGIEVIGSWEDGWCSSQTDTAPYIQVYFEYLTNITMIETEGVADEGSDLWVEKYYMSTSNSSESETFINYREDGRVKMFDANRNAKGVNISLQGTNAHFIRIHPVNFTPPYACMRIALYGCDEGNVVYQGSLLERIDNAPLSSEPVFDTGLAAIPVAVFIGLLISSLLFFLLPLQTPVLPSSPSQGRMMVEMQQQQQQQQPQPQDANGNANAEVPKYEVQTITMELGPDASTTEEHVNYSTDELFLGINKIFGYSSPNE